MQERVLEQHLGDRGLKTVKEQTMGATEAKSKEMFLGMDGSAKEKEASMKDIEEKAGNLPEHQSFGDEFFRGFGLRSGTSFPAIPGASGWAKRSAIEPEKHGGA
eukprot:TRINITY_DN6294_c0_g1_i1.p1 TRINITY_DN6294_c0_g1~~TRINITY_DN6294_c0_g1_i1.p1  ORF type:complete len:104 (-),score=38.34 TRINITY_DN6294_c0_g1_i1:126-437(-)